MNVLHVIPSLSDRRGGPTFVLKKMASALSSQGVHVDIACTNDDGRLTSHVPLGTPVQEYGASIYYFKRNTLFYTFSLSLLIWLWRNAGAYDVIHVHALFTFPTVAAAICARRHRKPFIIRPIGTLDTWGMEQRRPLLKKLSFEFIERHILAHATAIHVTSEMERKAVLYRFPAATSTPIIPNFVDLKTVVIPEPTDGISRPPDQNTIPPDLDQALSNNFCFLYLSRIDKKKGLEILLQAFARIYAGYPSARLVIAGEGDPEYVRNLYDLSNTLNLSKAVIWVGFVQGSAKWAILSRASVFVLPSYSENFAVAVIEAMSCGTPVVISENVGVADEIRQSSAGIVVSATVEGVEAGLLSLISDPGAARKLGLRGSEIARKNYSDAVCLMKLMNLYEKVSATQAPLQELTK